MYKLLGLLNIFLLLIMTGPFWIRKLNQRFFKHSSKKYVNFIKKLRKIHKPLGVIIVLIAAIHGYLALGAFKLHTGSITLSILIITGIFGGSYYFTKKKKLFSWHKRFAALAVLMLGIHLLFPNAVYYFFN